MEFQIGRLEEIELNQSEKSYGHKWDKGKTIFILTVSTIYSKLTSPRWIKTPATSPFLILKYNPESKECLSDKLQAMPHASCIRWQALILLFKNISKIISTQCSCRHFYKDSEKRWIVGEPYKELANPIARQRLVLWTVCVCFLQNCQYFCEKWRENRTVY